MTKKRYGKERDRGSEKRGAKKKPEKKRKNRGESQMMAKLSMIYIHLINICSFFLWFHLFPAKCTAFGALEQLFERSIAGFHSGSLWAEKPPTHFWPSQGSLWAKKKSHFYAQETSDGREIRGLGLNLMVTAYFASFETRKF